MNSQSFCLLPVGVHTGVCSHESYILQEGHPAAGEKRHLWLTLTFSFSFPKFCSERLRALYFFKVRI